MSNDVSSSGLTFVLEERIKNMEALLRDSVRRIEEAVKENREQHESKVESLEHRVTQLSIDVATFKVKWGIAGAVGSLVLSVVGALIVSALKGAPK